MYLLQFNWMSILLLAFSHFLILSDRAFSKKIRLQFQVAILASFISIVLNQGTDFCQENYPGVSGVLNGIEAVLRVFIICMLVSIANRGKKPYDRLIGLPLIAAIVLAFVGLDKWTFACSLAYIPIISIRLFSRKRQEFADVVFSLFVWSMFVLAAVAELVSGKLSIVNSCLAVIICIYYFYFIMRTYKRDRLTGLLIRHNLNYEMEDNVGKSYSLVLIDVDNFKLINDKYGHDKGDEVLVKIVDTTLKHLSTDCRMFRFGGDEFVILSRKLSTEKLAKTLEDVNDELSASELRISYGIVRHEPGTPSIASITEADKAMYENKRQIKSEDIWDVMTGLYNLRGFLDELDTFRRAVARDGHMVCLVGVDIERLSNINKAYGYSEGNLIITVLAKSMKKCLHGRDFIGHLGSDEFVMAVEIADEEDSSIPLLIRQLIELVDTDFELSTKDYSVKINADRYFISADDQRASEDCVNELLYMKQEDKDNRRKSDFAEEDNDYNGQEDEIVRDILDNNRFQYAFQPIVSAKDGSVVAYESLMRSDSETMVSPLKILKYAERNKRSYDVEKYTFFNTLEKFVTNPSVPENAKIFINSIPGHSLNDLDFDVLKSQYGHIFDRMVIEITEQREIDDDTLASMNTRRDKNGYSIAIDDFGSGVSNTNNLLRYMPQIVKIDRVLITGIDRNSKKQFFVNSIISFAKDNDMITLAEGVETENELKTLIKLGIDLIQGYVAAKPSVEVVSKIPAEISNLIIAENLKVGTNPRMIYTAGSACELSAVSLAMEDYTKINVSSEYLTIRGNSEFTADMTIKIKDNMDCKLVLADVKLNSVDDKPCIEVGENCNLTLKLEGENRFNGTGIYVPESSSITITGSGNLQIYVKGHDCYAIGADSQSAFGGITLKSSGTITLNVDGETGAGIGGGIAGENSWISVLSGTINLTAAAVKAVGIGSFVGTLPIRFVDNEFNCVFRVSNGAVMGSLSGIQDIELKSFTFDIAGSGTDLSVFGSPDEVKGSISLEAGSCKSKFSGHNVSFIGGASGDVSIDISHANMSMLGEGDFVSGYGTRTSEAKLRIRESGIQLTINASSPISFGTSEKEFIYIGANSLIMINGVKEEI